MPLARSARNSRLLVYSGTQETFFKQAGAKELSDSMVSAAQALAMMKVAEDAGVPIVYHSKAELVVEGEAEGQGRHRC